MRDSRRDRYSFGPSVGRSIYGASRTVKPGVRKALDMSEVGNLFVDGEAYERRMGRWTRLAGEAFLDWLDVPTGLQWLDVGCGSGAFTEVLTARCVPAKVVAIDLPFRAARGVGAIARRRG